MIPGSVVEALKSAFKQKNKVTEYATVKTTLSIILKPSFANIRYTQTELGNIIKKSVTITNLQSDGLIRLLFVL